MQDSDDTKETMIVKLKDIELDQLVLDYGKIVHDYIEKFHPSIR
jgi:hypothetical protein